MTTEPVSIEPVLQEIDALVQRIRAAEIAPNREYQRRRALMTLEGVGQVLRGFCLSPEGDEGYYEFEVGGRG